MRCLSVVVRLQSHVVGQQPDIHGLPRRCAPCNDSGGAASGPASSLRAKRGNPDVFDDPKPEIYAPPHDRTSLAGGITRSALSMLLLLVTISFPQFASAENTLAARWNNLWWTPGQQGQKAFEQGDYSAAAQLYKDPMRIGAAWYRAGEFEQAAAAFGRVVSAEGVYNRGNALVLLGQYGAAVEAYDRALEMKPGWEPAQQNREIALARKQRLEESGAKRGEATEIGADDVVFDLNAEQQQTQDEVTLDSGQGMSDQELRALWLRKSQTSPAVFLKSKFASQLAIQSAEEGTE